MTVSAAHALKAARHGVIFFNQSGLAKGVADTLVWDAAESNDAVLDAHDNDMKTLSRGHGISPAKFKTLSLLQLLCREANSAVIIAEAISLIEHEWIEGEGRERRLHIVIGDRMIRTHR